MSDYFTFLRGSWKDGAEQVVCSKEKTEHTDTYSFEVRVSVTPETSSAGKIYFSRGEHNTRHYSSAENLIDQLIAGLEEADLNDSEIEGFMNDLFETDS